jgi:hypothetical protein
MDGMLAPVIALVAWTLVVWWWMFALRIPAIAKLKIDPQKAADEPGSQPMLPLSVRRVSDNYNHLHEQPTIFYALALAMQIGGQTQELNLWLAWAYVGSRVLHSLVQATVNVVSLRFVIFAIGSLILMAMTVHAALGLPHHFG